MKRFLKDIYSHIHTHFGNPRIERYLTVAFEDDGVRVSCVRHDTRTHSVRISRDMFIRGINEHTIRRNKIMKSLFLIAYWPYRYRVYIIVPHHTGRSYTYTITYKRKNTDVITHDELDQFFSQQFAQLIETRKKETARKIGHDDVEILLVENRIVSVRVDGIPIVLDEYSQAPVAMKGKEIVFGIVQTFCTRALFSSCIRLLPKRALVYGAHEEGFCVASLLAQHAWNAPKGSNASFVVALVKRTGTDMFACLEKEGFFYDTMPSGFHSMYEIINTRIGLDEDSFQEVLHRIHTGIVSVHLKNKIKELLSVEIDRFMHGLQAAKKIVMARGIVLDPGLLRGYMESETQLKRITIDTNIVTTQKKLNTSNELKNSMIRMAEISCIVDIPRARGINKIANKHVRWLLPHAVEKVE